MQTDLLNQLKEQAVLLSLTEKRDLADFLEQQISPEKCSEYARINESDKLRQREQKWIEEHQNNYAGQWVALDGDTLLSHGPDGRKVYAEAIAKGVKVPFVVHLETDDEMPFGGW